MQFPAAFWKDDLETDVINFFSESGEWAQTYNIYKYMKVPVLLMQNSGEAAKKYAIMSDRDVMQSAMKVIRTIYPGAPDCVNFKRSNWGNDPNTFGAWAYI